MCSNTRPIGFQNNFNYKCHESVCLFIMILALWCMAYIVMSLQDVSVVTIRVNVIIKAHERPLKYLEFTLWLVCHTSWPAHFIIFDTNPLLFIFSVLFNWMCCLFSYIIKYPNYEVWWIYVSFRKFYLSKI